MSPLTGEVRRAALDWALSDPETVSRYRAKVVVVGGSSCRWWRGALSGRGHGRFWLASVDGHDVVIVAHRFGFALEHGVDELERVPVLGHRCDNPLCQAIGSGHVVRSSARENRREWATRRALAGGSLTDRRGSRGRARELRDALRADSGQPGFDLVALARLAADGVQLPLWAMEQA